MRTNKHVYIYYIIKRSHINTYVQTDLLHTHAHAMYAHIRMHAPHVRTHAVTFTIITLYKWLMIIKFVVIAV